MAWSIDRGLASADCSIFILNQTENLSLLILLGTGGAQLPVGNNPSHMAVQPSAL
jgi:hypothetical protein